MKREDAVQAKGDLVLHALHHAAIRENALQTVIEVGGHDAVDFFQRMSSNDLRTLAVGGTRMTSFLTDKGRLVDVVVVHARSDSLLIVPSEGRAEEFLRWIDRFVIMEDIRFLDLKSDLLSYSIIGPAAFTIASEGLGTHPEPGTHQEISLEGGTMLVASRQDFAINQVDCLVPSNAVRPFLDRLSVFGDALPLLDAECFDTLRTMTGIPAFGHEISLEFNPFEVGLIHTLNFSKGCYVGQEVIARLDTYKKIQRRLTGLTFRKAIPHPGAELFMNEEKIGHLTTIAPVPLEGMYHALAVVKKAGARSGDRVWTSTGMGGNEGILYDLPWTESVNA